MLSVIYRTLVGVDLPLCRDAVRVFFNPSRLGMIGRDGGYGRMSMTLQVAIMGSCIALGMGVGLGLNNFFKKRSFLCITLPDLLTLIQWGRYGLLSLQRFHGILRHFTGVFVVLGNLRGIWNLTVYLNYGVRLFHFSVVRKILLIF